MLIVLCCITLCQASSKHAHTLMGDTAVLVKYFTTAAVHPGDTVKGSHMFPVSVTWSAGVFHVCLYWNHLPVEEGLCN